MFYHFLSFPLTLFPPLCSLPSPPPSLLPPSQTKVFTQGMGTQVMLKKQDKSIPGKGMMNEVARSVLSAQELSTFNYYINQYQSHQLPVQDLVTPLLDLLNTPEKVKSNHY